MKFTKIIFVLFAITFSFMAQSQEVELFCKGNTSGTDIATSQREFVLNVDTNNGEMWGMPRFIAPMCVMPNEKTFISHSCEHTKNQFKCTCINTSGSTTLELSRVSAKLSINSSWNKNSEKWIGLFNCEKIQGRKF